MGCSEEPDEGISLSESLHKLPVSRAPLNLNSFSLYRRSTGLPRPVPEVGIRPPQGSTWKELVPFPPCWVDLIFVTKETVHTKGLQTITTRHRSVPISIRAARCDKFGSKREVIGDADHKRVPRGGTKGGVEAEADAELKEPRRIMPRIQNLKGKSRYANRRGNGRTLPSKEDKDFSANRPQGEGQRWRTAGD